MATNYKIVIFDNEGCFPCLEYSILILFLSILINYLIFRKKQVETMIVLQPSTFSILTATFFLEPFITIGVWINNELSYLHLNLDFSESQEY